jgi:2,3-dihydroxy-p-cumate/2,3-dihydroxybenzoate 3,4-dioxygenase
LCRRPGPAEGPARRLPRRHDGSGFLYFLGPEGFTYEYSFGVRRIEDDAAWTPRTFDPDEPGSIDMWLGPVSRPSSQPQLRPAPPPEMASARSAPGAAVPARAGSAS